MANAIEVENALAGTPKSTWDISGIGEAAIQGYATAMSVARGGTLSLKVHSPSSSWTGTVYRLGWYGGAGARQVATVTGPQTAQPAGTTDATTLMVSCANWTANGSWSVPADAAAGIYIIKVARTDNASLASHIGPFVVRDTTRKAPLTVKLSDTTWQAYNHCGADPDDVLDGRSLYGVGTSSSFSFNTGERCRAVSYDRPFVTRRFLPQTWIFNAEYPLIRWVERLGYDVDYVSSLDVDADPSLLLGRQVVVSSGHDEYWSTGMRDAFLDARDAGVSQAWLSANDVFWRINVAGRSYACWKDTLDGSLNSSGVYSGTWQDTRGFNPDRRPAALLNGQRFRLNGIAAVAPGATAAHAASPFWRDTAVASLAGAATWTGPVGVVGFEADEPADMDPAETPDGLIRLSEIIHTISGLLSDDDGANYDLSGPYTHAMALYQAESGALVFHAGTVQYAWALDNVHDRTPNNLEDDDLKQALTNILADLGVSPTAVPAGLATPTPIAATAYGFSGAPMAIVASDILLKLSTTAGAAGNTLAGTVGASLGKYVSTTTVAGAANDLFPSITGAENAASQVDYACVFVHNSHATLTLTGAKVYVSAEVSNGAAVAIGIDTTAASAVGSSSAQAVTIASDTTAPSGPTFSTPTTTGAALTLGDIAAGQVKAFWVRRSITPTTPVAGDGATFTVFGDTL